MHSSAFHFILRSPTRWLWISTCGKKNPMYTYGQTTQCYCSVLKQVTVTSTKMLCKRERFLREKDCCSETDKVHSLPARVHLLSSSHSNCKATHSSSWCKARALHVLLIKYSKRHVHVMLQGAKPNLTVQKTDGGCDFTKMGRRWSKLYMSAVVIFCQTTTSGGSADFIDSGATLVITLGMLCQNLKRGKMVSLSPKWWRCWRQSGN
jgi:hypothetical protein